LNQSPTVALKKEMLVEAWSGYKSSVKYLRVFKPIAYDHVPTLTQTKLDDRSTKTILIGYMNGGYKLFNPHTNKIVVTRDVLFDEQAM
jgi:hypothetical protein